MTYTQAQLLDAFCLAQEYDTEKLDGETKLQFLKRIERSWSKGQAVSYLQREARNAANLQVKTDADATDL